MNTKPFFVSRYGNLRQSYFTKAGDADRWRDRYGGRICYIQNGAGPFWRVDKPRDQSKQPQARGMNQ